MDLTWIFHKECQDFASEAPRHHICATQAFEAFDTFKDIGKVSSKECLYYRHSFETFKDLALQGTTFEPIRVWLAIFKFIRRYGGPRYSAAWAMAHILDPQTRIL